MISIDKIQGTADKKWVQFNFPTIDFKFQNTGRATAFLWRFVIEILKAEVDVRPNLEFSYRVDGKDLVVAVTNTGWGSACDCSILVTEPTLNRSFTDIKRSHRGTIKDGMDV